MTARALALAAACATLGACARHAEPAPQAASAATAPTPEASAPSDAPVTSPLLRGVAVISMEAPRVTPCGEPRALDLVDRTGGALVTVYGDLASQDTGEMYVELRGERTASSFIAASLVRALPMSDRRCDEASAKDGWRALGNEPFWSVRVAPDAITWEAPEGATTFPAAEPMTGPSGELTWTTAAGERRLALTLTRQPCRDSMSGAYFEMTARAVLDGTEVTGCAFGGS